MRYTQGFVSFPDYFQRRTRIQNILLLLLAAFWFIASPAYASKPVVYFAGVSFLGDHRFIDTNYPVATALNKATPEQPQAALDKAFFELLSAQSATLPFSLSRNLANYKSGPAIAMTLAIERESISIETFEDYRKVVAETSAQVLFFDFQAMRLIASIPVDIARNDVINLNASLDKARTDNLTALYQPTSNADNSLLSVASGHIRQFGLPKEGVLRFKVHAVNIGEKASPLVPERVQHDALAQVFGQYFTAQLTHLGGLNMIPYTKGYAIGNKMAGRMANGDVYTLTLPEADYVFTVDISNFKHIAQPNKHLFASRVKFTAKEATRSDAMLDDYFHAAVAKLVSDQQTYIDDWAAYEDALETVLSDLAQQLSAPEKKWFDNHSQLKRRTYNTFRKWSEHINGL